MKACRFWLCLMVAFLWANSSAVPADSHPKRLHLRPRPRISPEAELSTKPPETTLPSADRAAPVGVPETEGPVKPTSEDSNFTEAQSAEDPVILAAPGSDDDIADDDGDEENDITPPQVSPALRTSRRRQTSSARRPPHAASASSSVAQLTPRRSSGSRRQSLEAVTPGANRSSQRRGSRPSQRERSEEADTVADSEEGSSRGEDSQSEEHNSVGNGDVGSSSRRRGSTTYRTSAVRLKAPANSSSSRRRDEDVMEYTNSEQSAADSPLASLDEKATSADGQVTISEEQIPAAIGEPQETVQGSRDDQRSDEDEDDEDDSVIRGSSREIYARRRKRIRAPTNVKPTRRVANTVPAAREEQTHSVAKPLTDHEPSPGPDSTPTEARVPSRPTFTKTPRRRPKESVAVVKAPLPDQQNGIATAAARVVDRVEPQPKAKVPTPSSGLNSGDDAASNPGRQRRRRKKSRSRGSSSSQIAVSKSQIAAVSGTVPTEPTEPSLPVGKEGRKIVCYYTNWSQYRPAMGKFMPKNIDPFLCTHIVFAFSSLSGNRLAPFETNDVLMEDGQPGLYAQVTGLKEINPKLKVLLAIGGWSFGTQKFKDMSSNRYNRRTFIYSVAPYLREKEFDGLDLDWEYPKGATDKKNFAELVKELREAFEQEAQESGQERLLLTAAVPVGPDTVRSGYDVRTLARYLDLFHIMAYDFHGKWERQVGHNAPLNAPLGDSAYRRQLSVNASVHMWISMGAPKHKIVLGMPTYGRSFTLASLANTEVNAPTQGGGVPGPYTNEEGFLAYYEICQKLHGGAIYVWDDEMSVPYMIDGNQWTGFDDERAIRIKMKFVKEMDLAGAMVWSVDMDDFAAAGCGGATYPLMTAMREELLEIPRADQAPDIDWSKVAKRQAPPPPPVLRQPLLRQTSSQLSAGSQISVADILAILRAQGITPDLAAVQTLQAKVARARLPTSSVYSSLDYDDSPGVEENLAPPKIFCYVTGWARDRPGQGRFTPADLDPNLCTHVVWAFAGLTNGRLQLPSDDQERRDPDSDYQQILRLKELNPNLKVLLSLGGHAVDPDEFRSLTSSDYRINTFVYDTVDDIRRLKMDGLEVAWEYPSGAEDPVAFTRLIREFRLAFDSEASANTRARLLLTVPLPGDPATVRNGYDVSEISQHADFLSLLAYDMHGAWEDTVGHTAPLYPLSGAGPNELSLDRAARELVRAGAPPEKILIGLATYGRSFMLGDPEQYDIGAPVTDAGKPGRLTLEPGFAAHFEICDLLDRENTTLIWDDEQQVPFAFNGHYWVGFDDEHSLEKKISWLRELGFGGVQIWSADLDDFSGACGGGAYPLLTAVQRALHGYRTPYTYDGVTSSPARSDVRGGSALLQAAASGVAPVTCRNGDNDVTYHRDPADCKHYYLCQGSVRHHMPCPSDLVFNEGESVCDWPENVEECWGLTAAPPAG